MYNIIIKSVVYLSLITAFFIIIVNAGLSEQKNYYSWKNSSGVTQITKYISEIPLENRNDIKIFKSKVTLPWLNNFKNTPIIKILYGLITLFVLLTLSRNAIDNIFSYIIRKNNENLEKIIRNSNILVLSENQFKIATSSVLNKLGYKLNITDEILQNIIEFTATKNGIQHAVSVIYSDNPVSKTTLNYVVLEGSRLECENHIVVTNSYFSPDALDYSNSLNIKLIDREKMEKYIIDYGISPN